MMQRIVLEFSNGKKVTCSAPAFWFEGDDPITLESISVCEPEPLPPGCRFEELGESTVNSAS
jgi:hypothetical protein